MPSSTSCSSKRRAPRLHRRLRGLKDHVRSIKSTNWAATTKESRMPDVRGATRTTRSSASPETADRQDIFATHATPTSVKTWRRTKTTSAFFARRVQDVLLDALERRRCRFRRRPAADPPIGGTHQVRPRRAHLSPSSPTSKGALIPQALRRATIGRQRQATTGLLPREQGFMFQGGGTVLLALTGSRTPRR